MSRRPDAIVTTAWILLLSVLGFGFGAAVGHVITTMLSWK